VSITEFRRQWTEGDRELVQALIALGADTTLIAKVLKCTTDVVERDFEREWAVGAQKMNALVAVALYKAALNGSVQACVSWLRARANWDDKVDTLDAIADENPQRAAELLRRKADGLAGRKG
jgi:hypothetical protein